MFPHKVTAENVENSDKYTFLVTCCCLQYDFQVKYLHKTISRRTKNRMAPNKRVGVDLGVDSVLSVPHLDARIALLVAYKTNVFKP